MTYGARLSALAWAGTVGFFLLFATFSFPAEAQGSFALDVWLRAELDNGQHVGDYANRIRFEEDARIDWDQHDSTKPIPPERTPNFVLLSPEGVYNGNPIRQAVRSLPSNLAEALTISMAFQSTGAGSFEILTIPANIPDGWAFVLRDYVTQEVSDINTSAESIYDFVSGAVGRWDNRFEITIVPPGVVVETEDGPRSFRLSNAMPNPAGASTALMLRVDATQAVRGRVFDALGRVVATVYDGTVAVGEEARLEVDTSNLATGTYVVRVEGETFAEARRFAVIR